MWDTDNTILKHVRRTNRNLLIANVLLLLGLGLIAFCSWRATYNLMLGPWSITDAALSKMDPTKELQYNVKLKLEKDRLSPPIYEEFSIRTDKNTGEEKSRTTTSLYQLYISGQKVLLVKSPAGLNNPAEMSGGLVPIPDELAVKCVQGMEKTQPVLAGRFFPFMLDTTKFDGSNYIPLALMVPVFLLAIWKLITLQARQADQNKHPIISNARLYGDPREVAASIEEDLRMSGGGKRKGIPGLMTRDWLLIPSTWNLQIAKLDDLIWMYGHETKHSVNFIPTGSTWKVMLHFKDKRCIEMETGKKTVDEFLRELINRVPWAYAGFSEQLRACWQKQPQVMIDESYKARQEMSVKTSRPAEEDQYQ